MGWVGCELFLHSEDGEIHSRGMMMLPRYVFVPALCAPFSPFPIFPFSKALAQQEGRHGDGVVIVEWVKLFRELE